MPLSTLAHYIEFPKLGWRFPLDSTLVEFNLFGNTFSIQWYGVLIALGFLLAVMYAVRRAKDFGIEVDKMMDAALISTLMGFIGARLYYVFFSAQRDAYLADPLSILKIWEGGLGIYGGIIFAFGFGILLCRIYKINVLAMCDIASLGFLIGQAVGRWGNFFNQEAFGGNTTLPWGMSGDIIASGVNGSGYDPSLPVHPTFLYESLWCIAGFVLLHFISKKLYLYKGQIFCGYLVWYGVGRFFIEGLRTDSLMAGMLRTSQVVAVAAVIGGIILFFVLRRKAISLPKTLDLAEEAALDLPANDEAEQPTEATVQQAETDAENKENDHGDTN